MKSISQTRTPSQNRYHYSLHEIRCPLLLPRTPKTRYRVHEKHKNGKKKKRRGRQQHEFYDVYLMIITRSGVSDFIHTTLPSRPKIFSDTVSFHPYPFQPATRSHRLILDPDHANGVADRQHRQPLRHRHPPRNRLLTRRRHPQKDLQSFSSRKNVSIGGGKRKKKNESHFGSWYIKMHTYMRFSRNNISTDFT